MRFARCSRQPPVKHDNPYKYDPDKWDESLNDAIYQGRVRRAAKQFLHDEENPPQELPEILDLEARMARPRVETAFRIEGWQPMGGRVLLAAQFKAGKTTGVANLVRPLVDGGQWLDTWDVEPVKGRVCILDFEMSENTAEDWLNDQGIRNQSKVDLVSLRGRIATFNILDPGVRMEWASRLAQRETDYLIVDCLRPVLDAFGLDEHRDTGRFFGPLDALLNEAGIGEACVVHHMGHGGERSRGDSRLRDWPDVEWRLMRENEHPDSDRYITAYGRDVDIPEHKLVFDKDARRLRAQVGTRLDLDADAALLDVLAVLGRHGEAVSGRTIEAALKTTDHPRSSIRGALRLGIRRGLIDTRVGGHNATLYELPRASWVKSRFGGAES